MSVQTSKARLELCGECGRHGRLIDDAGKRGPEFGSQQIAQIALAVAVERGWIDFQMTEDLTFQIDGSTLPLTDADAEIALLYKIVHWNENLLSQGGKHEEFHWAFDN